MASDKIKTSLIFEILGRPPEHIRETLNQFIDKLGEQKGIKVTKKEIHEPHLAEKRDKKGNIIGMSEGLFVTFAEVEVEVDNLSLLFGIVVHMLPCNIEIIEPAELRLKNFDLSSALCELAVKIHKYDEIAKSCLIDRDNLVKEIDYLKKKIKEFEEKE